MYRHFDGHLNVPTDFRGLVLFVGLTNIYTRQKRKMSFRKGMFFLQLCYVTLGQKVKRCNVCFLLCVSVNIIILVVAVALFLLVLHHNFLSLNSLLRNEVSGMGTLTDALASVEDLELPVSHILSYITRFKGKKAFFLALQKLPKMLGKAGGIDGALAALQPCPCWEVDLFMNP